MVRTLVWAITQPGQIRDAIHLSTSPRHRDRLERKSSSLESSSSQCTRFVPPVRVNLRRARSGAVGAPGPRARPPEALGLSRGSRGERGRGSLLDGARSARRRRVVARVRRRKRPATMGNAPSAQTVFKSFKQAFDKLFGNKEMRVVMLGLDAAGKTTILYKLHIGEVLSTVPTLGTTREGNLATCFPSTSREDRLGFGFSGRAGSVGEKEGSPPPPLLVLTRAFVSSRHRPRLRWRIPRTPTQASTWRRCSTRT